MRFHYRPMIADFSAALAKISNQFFARLEFGAGWLVAIEIADQTDTERNVVQVIAMNMAAINLEPPPISDFDLAVAGRRAIADHEMVSEPVLHPTKMPMVIVERRRIALPRSAIVHNDVLPAATRDRRAIDLIANRGRQVSITCSAAAASAAAEQSSPKAARLFVTILFDR